jgi:hypothetical protein
MAFLLFGARATPKGGDGEGTDAILNDRAVLQAAG